MLKFNSNRETKLALPSRKRPPDTMRCMIVSPLPPAPGADKYTSLALSNTLFIVPGNEQVELLDSPATTTKWLIEHKLVPQETELQDYCHSKLTMLRTQLRHLFDAHIANTTPDPDILIQVNTTMRMAPQALTLEHHQKSGFVQVASHPVTQLVEHAMARIAEDAATLLTEEEASLIEQCGAPSCNRLFLRTHARRHWCSTRCGDRVRAARAYAKKKQS